MPRQRVRFQLKFISRLGIVCCSFISVFDGVSIFHLFQLFLVLYFTLTTSHMWQSKCVYLGTLARGDCNHIKISNTVAGAYFSLLFIEQKRLYLCRSWIFQTYQALAMATGYSVDECELEPFLCVAPFQTNESCFGIFTFDLFVFYCCLLLVSLWLESFTSLVLSCVR